MSTSFQTQQLSNIFQLQWWMTKSYTLTHLEEHADNILMSSWQDRKSFLVGDEDASWHNDSPDWLTRPALYLFFRWQVSSQHQNNSDLFVTVTQSSEPVPPAFQQHQITFTWHYYNNVTSINVHKINFNELLLDLCTKYRLLLHNIYTVH